MSNYILTLGYSNAAVFKAGMTSLHRTVDFTRIREHLILDQHYPLKHEEVREAFETYADDHDNVTILDDHKNLGLHEGLNYMLERLYLKDDDVVYVFDADEDPQDFGWAEAMEEVFKADPKVGWLSMMAPPCREHLDQQRVPVETVAGVNLRFPQHPLMNTVIAWSGRAIKAMGPMREPHAFYGGIESTMQSKCMADGFRVGWLNDYNVLPHHDLADAEYMLYKQHHVGHKQPVYPGEFNQWLKDRGCL